MATAHPLLFAAIAALLFALSAPGCAFDELQAGGQCDYDTDCADDEYCIGAQCAPRCTDDDECPSGTSCQAYQRGDDAGPIQACIDADADYDGSVECQDDAQCRDALDDPGARCGMHGRCILSAGDDNGNDAANQDQNESEPVDPTWRTILQIDQLDADGDPVDPDDLIPDPDDTPHPVRLGAVLVRDDTDTAVGFGQLLALESTADTTSAELADAPVTLDDSDTCVKEPRQAPFASLGGPGGTAWIELVDGQRAPVALGDQWRVQIVADGPQCPLGEDDAQSTSDDDDIDWGQYRVQWCETDATDPLPDGLDCHRVLGYQLSHFSELNVTTDL